MISDDVESFVPENSDVKLMEPCLFFVTMLQWLLGVDCNLQFAIQNVVLSFFEPN